MLNIYKYCQVCRQQQQQPGHSDGSDLDRTSKSPNSNHHRHHHHHHRHHNHDKSYHHTDYLYPPEGEQLQQKQQPNRSNRRQKRRKQHSNSCSRKSVGVHHLPPPLCHTQVDATAKAIQHILEQGIQCYFYLSLSLSSI